MTRGKRIIKEHDHVSNHVGNQTGIAFHALPETGITVQTTDFLNKTVIKSVAVQGMGHGSCTAFSKIPLQIKDGKDVAFILMRLNILLSFKYQLLQFVT